MNAKITALHFKADSKLETFIQEKIDKLIKKTDHIIGSEVTLKLENTDKPENKTVEIRFLVRGNDLFATKTSKSFEEATDNSLDAIRKQLIKSKEKIKGL